MTQQPTGFALSPQQLAVGPDARVGGVIRAEGPVTVQQVTAALDALVTRHEVLRTTFPTLPGTAQPLAVVSDQADASAFRVEGRGDGVDVIWDVPARMLDEASLGTLAAELAELCAGGSHDEEPLQYVDYAGWVLEEGTVSCTPGRGRRTRRTTRRPIPEQGITPQDWWRATAADDTERAVLVDGRVGDELVGAVGAYAHWSGSPGATVGWAAQAPGATTRQGVRWEALDWWSTHGPPLVLRVGVEETWIELDERWCSLADAEALLDALLAQVSEAPAAQDRGLSPSPGARASVVAWMGRPAHGLTLTDGTRTWTPREVRTRVGQIAADVGARTGGRREAAVALSVRPGLDAVVGLLGIWQAGGVAVPVEAGGPARRVTAQLDLVEPVAVVTDDPAARWPVPAVSLTPDSPVWQRDPTPPATPLPGQLACTMFTSGSTGAPKGVDVPHAALAAYATGVIARLGIGPDSSWSLVTPLTADLGFTALLAALWTSGTLVVAPTVEADVAAADWAKITPRHLALLLDTSSDPRARLPRTGVVIGGEQWPLTLRDRLVGLRPGLRVVNHYGPTETAVGVLVGEVRQQDTGEHPTLGQSLAHVHALVLDQAGEPTDGSGELVIGGASVARGYRGRPRLTAECFRPDPSANGGRCYWTGDLVKRAPDGPVVHAGRRDAQLSINGFRVEPGEIVAALQGHPSVAAAAVTTVDGGASLHAVLVADPTAVIPSLGELRAWLADRLPAALTPAALTWVPALPTTPTGKLDTGAVAALAARPRGADRPAARPPATATEAALVAVWADVLGVRDVGVEDDFFALGGDSIRSLQVVSRARAAGLAFTPQDVFAHPTVQALAAIVVPLAEQPPRDDDPLGPVPLLPAAAELLGRGGPDPQHYNQAFWLTAAEPLDVAALRAALEAVVARHDVLRTAFLPGLRGWRSELMDGVDGVPLTVVDLREDADPAAAADALARSAQRELMLGRPPLMACWVLRLPEGDRLLWVAHHLVVDAVSWQVLFEQVQRAYLQVRAGVAVDLGPRTVSHRSWAVALAARSDAGVTEIGGPPDNATNPPSAVPLIVADTVTVTSALTTGATADLLDRAAPILRVSGVAAVLGLVLAALAQDDPSTAPEVEVELHGRDVVPGLDAARTVGWLTSRHVLRPIVQTSRGREAPGSTGEALESTGEASTGEALGSTGVADWLRAAARALTDPGPAESRSSVGGRVPTVGLTYLGRTQRRFPAGSPFDTFTELRAGVRAPTTPVRWPLEIAAEVVEGCLLLHWTAAASAPEQARVAHLTQALPELVAELAAETADTDAPLRPEVFPDATLTTDDLDALLAQWQAEGFG